MVRHYKRKTDRGQSYTKEDLEIVVEQIKRGQKTIRGASLEFKIPFSTLQKHLKGIRGLKSKTQGKSSVIPEKDEQYLADGIKTMAKWGWGLSRKEILNVVGDYVQKNHIDTPFKNGIPGKDWFIGFKARHKLSIKKPQTLEYARKKASADPFIIEEYFDILNQTITDLELKDKPKQIYNLDETSFCLDPSRTKVVSEKNSPSSRVTSGPGRESTTVLFGANANGDKIPPLIVFKGKYIWDSWMAPKDTAYPNISYGASPNGWMQTDIFNNYFTKVFLNECVKERPLLVIYDGHSTHLDLSVIEAAAADDVTIIKLPPHTSHLLQPLDLCTFKSIKSRWDEKLSEYQRKHIGMKVPKSDFSVLVSNVWRDTTPENLKQGFRKGGIHPFNRNVVDKSKYDPEIYKRYEDSKNKKQSPEKKVKTPTKKMSPSKKTECLSTKSLEPKQLQLDPQPSTSKTDSLESVSFQQLLLETIKQQPKPEKKSRKKVAPGAEVVTSADYIKMLKIKKESEEAEEKRKQVGREAKIKIKAEKDKLRGLNQAKKASCLKKTKSTLIFDETSSDEDADLLSLPSSDDLGSMTMESLMNDLEDGEAIDLGLTPEEVKAGNWVLVKFTTKKKVVHFVGQVVEVLNSEELCVTYVRKSSESGGTSTFTWPLEPDMSSIQRSDIVRLLPEPNLGRRGEVLFNVSFASFNIQ